MRNGYIFGSLFLAILVLLTVSFTNDRDRFRERTDLIVLRKMGHEILMAGGDSTSRVLPVQEIAGNEFELQFGSPLAIKPQELIKIVEKNAAIYGLPLKYSVLVKNCRDNKTVYGFLISGNKATDIVTCMERGLPKSCYTVNIKFAFNVVADSTNKYYIAGGLGIIAILSLYSFTSIWNRKRKLSGISADDKESKSIGVKNDELVSKDVVDGAGLVNDRIKIGTYHFNPEQQWLERAGERISLTGKEAKLLGIFAGSPNIIIDRSQLQKLVWEDEGVIVTRSLDMFVSKLRRKLEGDANIRIVNVHGKGYKLEIGEL